ncbi:MAG: 3-hydroxyacyl-CoA dehydrogenase NAD-binding domain-containing protein [Hydrogenophaga sp.]|jgi:3-hydroxyacyl-CoA dehydrogenase/enoyl-CoA hydratase/3-hydroxybutyryl-CoA epimerase|uniref:3-hydroxyacyl-CoA dehydrogenase NAD-binding domain-containing protein n=1 Tax=Hydrogenophaga sp. TaxID=1904254 RepID=UPI002A362EF4|nr:3-hydroxyacyl-CoA dehydrogenase NAD-binding domain-containing protein [Hydrogenophaga sp.]MDX9969766.1 3-hydroxyacyl-CoA dehydrogenase NAD-binding domain-containing protein [Hydrogenophaga sp.]
MITKTIRYDLAQGIATITFDEQGSPVNTMCLQWQDDFETVTRQVEKDREQIRGIILASAKSTFFAGADLKAVMRSSEADGPRVFAEIERIKRHFRTLETLGVPVVTCLNGAALGGGWEVALVGHHRIAVNDPKIRFGLPEITLGLIPGGGGITKMTRILGLAAAQPYILESKLFGPDEAMKIGVVHELVATADELMPRARAFIEAAQGKPEACTHVWDRKDDKMPGGTPASPKVAAMLSVAPAMLKRKTQGLYPAPEAALAAMAEGALVDFDTAMRIETRYLAGLMVGQVARNMINTFFFHMNAVKGGQSRPKGVPKYQPKKVGILGAGMMGSGIAYVQATQGIATVLKDVSIEAAEKGKAYTTRLTQQRVDKGQMSAERQQGILNLITPTAQATDLRGCDLIIEAVFEQRELKAMVTQEAEPMLAEGGFFASNTSTLPISSLARASTAPQKFVGIHFFSPVDKMKLVEIIRGQDTDDETIARAYDYVQALGKLPIVVNDSRGFYTSRTFGTYVMEGAAMLGEGIPAPVIENAAVQAGMPVGPLAVLDETSLSLSVHVLEQTRIDCRQEGKPYVATAGETLVERMVKRHHRPGRAGGGGFYDYPEGGRKHLWPELKTLFEKPGVAWDLQDVKDRLLFRQAVETARCLAEGVLTSVHDGNIGSIFGIGFPAWTGGALQFIYGQGIETFEQRCTELAARYGSGFELSEAVKSSLRQHQPRY